MSRRKSKLLDYITKNKYVSNYCLDAKAACGYPVKAICRYRSMSNAMTELWQEGHISGVKLNGRWIYSII